MKKLTFLFSIALLFGCLGEDCLYPSGPLAPEGYTISRITTDDPASTIVSDLAHFQMIDVTTGYGLKNRKLFKTSNGGKTWYVATEFSAFTVESLLFMDENTGYLSHRGDDSGAFILKTTDGGSTWEDMAVTGFPYHFIELQADQAGNLYALDGEFGIADVVKSTDGGRTWTKIYVSDASYITRLTVQEERIYFMESSDQLTILNLDGEVMDSSQIRGNDQLVILDEDNMIVLDQYRAHKTTDGGGTWTEFFSNVAHVVDYSREDGLIMLLGKDYCGDNPNELSAFATGSVESFALEEAASMTGFDAEFLYDAEKVGAGHYLLRHFEGLYSLQKQ